MNESDEWVVGDCSKGWALQLQMTFYHNMKYDILEHTGVTGFWNEGDVLGGSV